MDQIKTGKFIAERRKAKNLTQRELAERLLVSDKTVSKWETGKGLPEVSLMMPLCEILGINVNELLSGELIESAAYQKYAEENMMKLIDERKENKRKLILEFVVVLITLLASITLIMVAGYIDLTTPIRILLIGIAIAVMAGGIGVVAVLEMTAGYFECAKCGKKSWARRRLALPDEKE